MLPTSIFTQSYVTDDDYRRSGYIRVSVDKGIEK